ncbi:MAG: YvcK family protein [Coriobacteriia bacterium]|nr:YvcK family protein [Coriobacteriia bacterium]
MTGGSRRAVALGGGTGMPVVLSCLVELGFRTTAVVTAADDGGSSGMLRRELGILPPGDARNCLIALAEPGNALAEVFRYRFPRGEGLAGHALGNLIIAALADIEGGFAEALAEAGELLRARGRVLPSTLDDVALHAEDRSGRPLSGQANIARSASAVSRVALDPPSPRAYAPAVEAIESADAVVIGPGSLFTSIIPNVLVPGIVDALRRTRAKRLYVCNVANQRGETAGMDAYGHVKALREHGVDGALDAVLVNDAARLGRRLLQSDTEVDVVDAGRDVVERIRREGVAVTVADVAAEDDCRHHSKAKLARALEEVL